MTDEVRILVVDDESSVRFLLSEALTQQGYQVCTAASGEEALAMLEEVTFDLMLLDLKMPGMDGIEVMRVARDLAPRTVVVMLTAYATLDSAVEALRYGGHDYLLKPSSPDEILASVEKGLAKRQQWRRQEDLIQRMGNLARQLAEGEVSVIAAESRDEEQARYLRVGDLLLDRARLIVISAGESVALTPSEYRLLLCLMENAGSTVGFGALAEAVHGVACEEATAKRAISTHLWRLRRKLNAVARSAVQIANTRGEGYVLLESRAD